MEKATSTQLSAVLTIAEEGGYIAYNPDTGTTTQGESIEDALDNLREATALYLEEFPLLFLLYAYFNNHTGSNPCLNYL